MEIWIVLYIELQLLNHQNHYVDSSALHVSIDIMVQYSEGECNVILHVDLQGIIVSICRRDTGRGGLRWQCRRCCSYRNRSWASRTHCTAVVWSIHLACESKWHGSRGQRSSKTPRWTILPAIDRLSSTGSSSVDGGLIRRRCVSSSMDVAWQNRGSMILTERPTLGYNTDMLSDEDNHLKG